MSCAHCNRPICFLPYYLECCSALFCDKCYELGCQCDVKATPVFQRFLALSISEREPFRNAESLLKERDPHLIMDLMRGEISEKEMAAKPCVNVYLDFETTDINPRTCRITQIGAMCEDKSFNTYVKADKPMNPEATKITGIKDSDLKDAPPCKEALNLFFDWLDSVRDKKSVICVAHNGSGYDFILLLCELHRWDMPAYQILAKHGIVRFVDTLPWARVNIPPHRLVKKVENNEPSFRLGDLYESVMGCRFECAHDALADCKALKQFCESGYVKDKCLNLDSHDGHSCFGIKEYISDFTRRKQAEDSDMSKEIARKADEKGCQKRTLLQFFSKLPETSGKLADEKKRRKI